MGIERQIGQGHIGHFSPRRETELIQVVSSFCSPSSHLPVPELLLLFSGGGEVFLTDKQLTLTIRECPVTEGKKRELKQVISKSVMNYRSCKNLI